MYDAVQVLVDAILRALRKKPDMLRSTTRRNLNQNSNKSMECTPNGNISPYEHGDKISKMIKKVFLNFLKDISDHFNTIRHQTGSLFGVLFM